MQVRFVGNKAQQASNKHFGGKLSDAQMSQLVRTTIKNRTHVGESDRANNGHTTAKVVWGLVGSITIGLVLDGNDIKRNIATVVSVYDVHNVASKAKRFNMKEVK